MGDRFCCVKECFNSIHTSSGLSFFRFPKSEERCVLWLESCGRQDLHHRRVNLHHSHFRVCGTHFEVNCFAKPHLKNRLTGNAVPTLFSKTLVGTKLPSRLKDDTPLVLLNRSLLNTDSCKVTCSVCARDACDCTTDQTSVSECDAGTSTAVDVKVNRIEYLATIKLSESEDSADSSNESVLEIESTSVVTRTDCSILEENMIEIACTSNETLSEAKVKLENIKTEFSSATTVCDSNILEHNVNQSEDSNITQDTDTDVTQRIKTENESTSRTTVGDSNILEHNINQSEDSNITQDTDTDVTQRIKTENESTSRTTVKQIKMETFNPEASTTVKQIKMKTFNPQASTRALEKNRNHFPRQIKIKDSFSQNLQKSPHKELSTKEKENNMKNTAIQTSPSLTRSLVQEFLSKQKRSAAKNNIEIVNVNPGTSREVDKEEILIRSGSSSKEIPKEGLENSEELKHPKTRISRQQLCPRVVLKKLKFDSQEQPSTSLEPCPNENELIVVAGTEVQNIQCTICDKTCSSKEL